ncbi:hypothetical protein RQP46_001036 [Phenoliferia psychrophenolica]
MSLPEKSDYSPPASPSVDAVVPSPQVVVIQDQPAAVEKMVVAGASPRNALNVAVNAVTGKRDWSYGTMMNADCFRMMAWSWCGCGCIPLAQEREALQRRYNIEGSGGDIVATICCAGCVQVQHSREIEEEERFLKGHSH